VFAAKGHDAITRTPTDLLVHRRVQGRPSAKQREVEQRERQKDEEKVKEHQMKLIAVAQALIPHHDALVKVQLTVGR
jgi:hypothetical protein